MIDRKRLNPKKYPVLFWHAAVEPRDVDAVHGTIMQFKDCFEIRAAFERELLALMRDCEQRGRQKERRAKTRR
jgi:hypothetical protein